MNYTNFVNESRNIVWLSGYVRKGDRDGEMLLYQSSNEDRAIPIHAGPRIRRPRPNAPVEVKCHAFGFRDESGKSRMRLDAIQIKRAGVATTPRRLVALNALRPRSVMLSPDYTPFASLEQLKSEVRESLNLDALVVDGLLADASKKTSMHDSFLNKVILSGFVGQKAYIPPRDIGSGDRGHVLFQLLQHGDADAALPIRISGVNDRFGKELKALHPLSVIGRVYVEVEHDDDGNIVARNLSLSTDRNNVGFATVNEFAAKRFPGWWHNAVTDYHQQRHALAERSRAQASQAKPADPGPSPEAQSEPEPKPEAVTPQADASGVQVSDEVY